MQKLLGRPAAPLRLAAVGGGCIHRSFRLQVGGDAYFLKCNDAARQDLFAAEADGLQALADAGHVRVPATLGQGVHGDTAWLLLEWLELAPLGAGAAVQLGEALAAQHAEVRDPCGWHRDNFIGASVQQNRPAADWPAFFRERRLAPQLQWALSAGLLSASTGRTAETVLRGIERFFPDGPAPPALLHGDLWGGNAAQDAAGRPVVFDPAVYCGDPETDLAMMDLFGGFPAAFWSAYHAVHPRRPGCERRRTLYQLYHVLNHVNLFGGGYVAQAGRLIDKLAEPR